MNKKIYSEVIKLHPKKLALLTTALLEEWDEEQALEFVRAANE